MPRSSAAIPGSGPTRTSAATSGFWNLFRPTALPTSRATTWSSGPVRKRSIWSATSKTGSYDPARNASHRPAALAVAEGPGELAGKERPPVDHPGVDLDERGPGIELLRRRNHIGDPADPDDSQATAGRPGDIGDDLGRAAAKGPAAQAARLRHRGKGPGPGQGGVRRNDAVDPVVGD